MKRTFFTGIGFILLFTIALLIVALPALAQPPGADTSDAPAEVAPVEIATELLTANEADELFKSIGRSAGLGTLVGAPLVLVVTQLLKFVPYLDRFKAENMAAIVATVLVIVGALAFNAGYGDIFDTSYSFLSGIAQPLVAIIGAFAGGGLLFSKVVQPASGDKLGFMSRSRTPGA